MDADLTDLAGGDGVSVHAGFPNPALDRRGQDQGLALDLNRLLIRHPSATYLFRIAGHRWSDQGIHDGDVVVIDRSVPGREADLVVSWQDDDFRLCRRSQLETGETAWGVLTAVIHQYRP
jgi:DNA polymerase V